MDNQITKTTFWHLFPVQALTIKHPCEAGYHYAQVKAKESEGSEKVTNMAMFSQLLGRKVNSLTPVAQLFLFSLGQNKSKHKTKQNNLKSRTSNAWEG